MPTYPLTYYLEVEKIAKHCRFLLKWGNNQRLPLVAIAYSENLATSYREWQLAYLNYYNHISINKSLRGRVQGSGSFSVSNVDWYEKLREAEEKLIREFNFWLRSPELYELWEEIKRSSRFVSTQSQSTNTSSIHIDLLISCSEELRCLPWELWKLQDEFASIDTVRVARLVYSCAEALPSPQRQRPRVLAIFGDETGLDFQQDRQAMQILSKLAEIHTIRWDADTDSEINQKQKICKAISDPQGWDILFFTGHSDQTNLTVGKLMVVPNSSLTMSDLEPYLLQARERGLQIAIFNSCNGTEIATWVISKVGIPQAIAMREPIHNQAAQSFLVQFLQNLAQHKDAHTSMFEACRYLQEEHLTFPSVYLVPSLFRHPAAQLFKIPPKGINTFIRRVLPTPLQAIAISALLATSLFPPLQEWMLDRRVWIQAIYRQHTQRIPKEPPPVLLVQIDEASLQKAAIADPHPMDRTYLAKLVDRLASENAKVIGIDYLLDRSHRNRKDAKDDGQSDRTSDHILGKSIQNAVERQTNSTNGTWFVLASVYSEGDWLETLPEIASKNGSIDGHIHMSVQYLPLLQADVPKLPFSYLLAGVAKVRESKTLRSPLAENETLFAQISDTLRFQGKTFHSLISQKAQMLTITDFAQDKFSQSWLHPIVDFSIPPDRIYQTIPAWQLLENKPQIPDSQIVLISANYSEAGVFKQGEDSFMQPTAIYYWLQQSPLTRQRETYTGGEVQAYAIHHFLRDHYVVPIPDSWMMLLFLAGGAILVGSWQPQSRRQVYITLTTSLSLYTLASIEIYISGGLILPIVFPAIVAIVYCLPKLLR
ncbi:CHASE2 domain-containing protein [Pseudanabaena sp. FACHB-1998]|uniref:CHASE2 domain-containing protein n=1 Tax=Pseudanabaena sp. FACHB-1998 TaxID=2692858 RepID=UPI00168043C0|nr:CHASE2 domain-containing protein [Pseudanabaena sp. FACHB-1998]MBD2179335.1 CHASE2 domain-containing protein [Pseudanabaena sp. FACHB-1998]